MAASDRQTYVCKFVDVSSIRDEIEQKRDEESNLEIGDFLSELRTVIRTKIKTSLAEGDWIEDPERIYFDGNVFGEEVRSASDVKIQIAICVDVSQSTYANNTAGKISRALFALDKVIRKAMVELPEGALAYKVFAFNKDTYIIDDVTLLNTTTSTKKGAVEDGAMLMFGTWTVAAQGRPVQRHLSGAQKFALAEFYRASNIKYKTFYEENWADTLVAPLFTAIEKWEQNEGDHSAYRIDIILSDGEWENKTDIVEATKIQERRNGRLTTFMLNFLPRQKWGNYSLPERCYQYEANPKFLGQQIRQIISDSLLELA